MEFRVPITSPQLVAELNRSVMRLSTLRLLLVLREHQRVAVSVLVIVVPSDFEISIVLVQLY